MFSTSWLHKYFLRNNFGISDSYKSLDSITETIFSVMKIYAMLLFNFKPDFNITTELGRYFKPYYYCYSH